MAKRRKATATAIAVPLSEPVDRECVLKLATAYADSTRGRLREATLKFMDAFLEHPSYALEWKVGNIPALEHEAAEWGTALAYLTQERPDEKFREALERTASHAQEEINRVVRLKSWNQHSTSPWANLVEIGRINGRVEAWSKILEFARWAIREMGKETTKAPVAQEVTECSPSSPS